MIALNHPRRLRRRRVAARARPAVEMYTDVQRWPSDQSEYDEERVQAAPRIVLMGSRRSGKTSMERVVFGKMSPHETLFVASTSTPTLRLVANSELVHFAIFDIPGGCELGELSHHGAALTPMAVFSRCVVLVYVVDAEADPYAECARLAEVVALARRVNPRVGLEVFVHKVDGDHFLSEEQKLGCRREIEACVRAELAELTRGDAKAEDEAADEAASAAASAALQGAAFNLTSISGRDKGDSTSLQRECSARARFGNSTHASRPFREMIARPKISRNERETAEIGAF